MYEHVLLSLHILTNIIIIPSPPGADEHVLPRRRRGVHVGRGAAHGSSRIIDVRGDRQGSDPRGDAVHPRSQDDHQGVPRTLRQTLPREQGMLLKACLYGQFYRPQWKMPLRNVSLDWSLFQFNCSVTKILKLRPIGNEHQMGPSQLSCAYCITMTSLSRIPL